MAYSIGNPLRGKPADAPWDTITSSPDDTPEHTTVDKAWGLLFDKGSQTQRFEQFTRGIADHIVS